MIGLGNVHRCSADPIEAGSYCLQAKASMIEKFSANGKAELTIDVTERSGKIWKKKKKKNEHSVVELPVDFTKEYLVRVSRDKIKTTHVSRKCNG